MSRRATPSFDRAAFSFEQLEQRTVFSAPYDFAGVGIRYDGAGPQVYVVEGTIEEDDDVTGTMRFADLAGVGPDAPIDWSRYNRNDDGSFTFDVRSGFTPYDSQVGTRFIREERRPMGSFVGRDADGDTRDFAALLQTYTPEDVRSAFGSGLQFNLMRLTPQGDLETVAVRAYVDFSTALARLNFEYAFASGAVTSTKTVVSVADGKVTFDSGEILFLNGFRDDFVFADLDSSDGIVGIGAGRVVIDTAHPNGRYRTSLIATGPQSAEFFGGSSSDIGPEGTAVYNVVIDMQLHSVASTAFPDASPNVFIIYRQSEYDMGLRNPIEQGVWHLADDGDHSVNMDFLELLTPDGKTLIIRSSDSSAFFVEELRGDGGSSELVFGVGSASERFGNQIIEYQTTVENGRPIAYVDLRFLDDLLTPSPWSVDLIRDVGGEEVTGELVSWSVANARSHSFAGLSASGDVQVWEYHYDYGWVYTNLTDELEGAAPIVGELFYTMYDTGGFPGAFGNNQQFLAGYDADGDFVVYHQLFGSLIDVQQTWQYLAVGETGFEGGATLPDFATGLSGWTSSWGAAHFAGIDQDGELWSVWWSPSLEHWQITNLTDVAETPALVSRPTVVVTDWDSFHIHSTDADGNLIVTWWARELDTWTTNNLTDELGGPALEANSLASNFSTYPDNLNIVGRDSNGQARIYWWNPGSGWNIGNLTAGLASQDIPLEPWRMTATWWLTVPNPPYEQAHSQSLLGTNAEGDLVRLLWRSHEPDGWILQNISEISRPYFM